MHPRLFIPGMCLFVLTACGGGGGGGGSADGTVQTITEYYDAARTQVKRVGPAVVAADGSYIKQGVWTEYFPAGSVQFIKAYAADGWDTAQPWTEFNADGSWRVDSGD